jgi:hypothetical protein
MPWYQAVLLLGSVAMSLIILIRPTSDGRRMAFTLVLGALMLVTIGLAGYPLRPGSPTKGRSAERRL